MKSLPAQLYRPRRSRVPSSVLTALLWLPAIAAARPDPLDPAAPVPAFSHSSALTHAPSLTETQVGSWREANDTVNRIGGWRTYAREAKPSQPPQAAPGGSPTQTAPAKPATGHNHP